jgi:hypothetical protein
MAAPDRAPALIRPKDSTTLVPAGSHLSSEVATP